MSSPPDYGPQSHWSWQVFAVDFIWEEDIWRIWHMQCLTELDTLCGTDWAKRPPPPKLRPEFCPAAAGFPARPHGENPGPPALEPHPAGNRAAAPASAL